MNSEQFIEKIKLYVRDAVIKGVINNLKKPPGRRPKQKDIVLSQWFNELSREDY